MVDLHLVLPALNLYILDFLDAGILIIVKGLRGWWVAWSDLVSAPGPINLRTYWNLGGLRTKGLGNIREN